MGLIDVNFAGRSFKMNAHDGMDQVVRQMQDGAYEPPLPFLMMATLVRTEGAFLDVGANTGLYSIMAAAIAVDREILSFEPHPRIAEILRQNVACNDMQGRVVIHEYALSETSGVLQLYLPDQGHGLLETSASLEENFQPVVSSIDVEVKRLDDIGFTQRIGVIKVDIEGHEDSFLRGGTCLIQRDRPIIFAEVLGKAKRNLLSKFLRDTSYIDFRLRPDMAIHDGDVLFDYTAWNHAFVPLERLTRFKEACDSCSLPMLRRFSLAY